MVDNTGCSGCKIGMFCGNRGRDEGCETSLKAVCLAFVIPLIAIVSILAVGQVYLDESISVMLIVLFLVLYFFSIKLLKPRF